MLQPQLTLEFHDMKSLFPVADVHGAIWFRDARIGLDQGLDPYVQPARRGRYHFTLSHEIGHWRLHRQHFLKHPTERTLFYRVQAPPDVISRTGKWKPPVEWQANYFASCLLMPRAMVVSEWTDIREGNDQPMKKSQDIIARDSSESIVRTVASQRREGKNKIPNRPEAVDGDFDAGTT